VAKMKPVPIDELDTLKLHEVSKLFPPMADEEYEATKADIAANGVVSPAIVKDNYVFDGGNRLRILKDLKRSGVTVASASNKPLVLPVTEYDGTVEELVALVLTMNMRRRHLNSSQRACVAIDCDQYLVRLRKQGRKGKKGDAEPEPEPDEKSLGDFAEKLAAEVATNRAYIFSARILKEHAPDLYKAVRDGNESIPAAMKAYNQRQNGGGGGKKSSGDQGGGDQGGGAEPPPTPTDELGNEIPEKLRPVFSAVSAFEQVIDTVRVAKKTADDLIADKEGSEALKYDDLDQCFKDAAKILRRAKPYCLCQKCSDGRGCDGCESRGWWSKAAYDDYRKDQKRAEGGDPSKNGADGLHADPEVPAETA
jgi:hypothetical protein